MMVSSMFKIKNGISSETKLIQKPHSSELFQWEYSTIGLIAMARGLTFYQPPLPVTVCMRKSTMLCFFTCMKTDTAKTVQQVTRTVHRNY